MAAGSLPLADAHALWPFARRTRLVRVGLGIALLALFAATVFSAFNLHTRATSYFAAGGRGILVLDLSASVDPRANERLRTLVRTLANSDQRLGLVVFEEQTYELLPPGTRGDEIRPMLRFFGTSSPSVTRETPWTVSFLGGTNIGPGLRLARQAAERNGAGSVLLVSDLQDSTSDLPLLADEIGAYRTEGIRLRVLPMFPPPSALALFTSLAGKNVIVDERVLRENAAVAQHQSVVAAFPGWAFLLAAALLVALAANEYLGRRLEWSPS
jgi:von Willebrand factor type A domain